MLIKCNFIFEHCLGKFFAHLLMRHVRLPIYLSRKIQGKQSLFPGVFSIAAVQCEDN